MLLSPSLVIVVSIIVIFFILFLLLFFVRRRSNGWSPQAPPHEGEMAEGYKSEEEMAEEYKSEEEMAEEYKSEEDQDEFMPKEERNIPMKEYKVEYELAQSPPAKTRSEDKDVVNVGFSSISQPRKKLGNKMSLASNKPYYFWFEIGEFIEGGIGKKEHVVPTDKLPPEAQLKVVLFDFKDEIVITPGRDMGEVKFVADWHKEESSTGKVRIMRDLFWKVVRRVDQPENIDSRDEILDRRLFFPIHTPNKVGDFRFRCNIYYKQNLVQSYLIKSRVTYEQKRSEVPVLSSTLEYNINKKLDSTNLVDMEPKVLSVMLNENGDGTHCFRVVGSKDFKGNRSFDAEALEEHVELSRMAFRKATWGDEEPWSEDKNESDDYRYRVGNSEFLKDDLILMAIRGRRFWYAFTGMNEVAPNHEDLSKLADIMLEPACLEFAIKEETEASKYMFPAAMIYDYDLDTGIKPEYITLCPSFIDSLKSEEALENTECFKGNCPSRGNDRVVCPSGFWGFRHCIGIPFGIEQEESTVRIVYDDSLRFAVSSWPFDTWATHKEELQSFKLKMDWIEADSITNTLLNLEKNAPHLVYFYCHGGFGGPKENIPYIKVRRHEVLDRERQSGITPDNLDSISWASPRPLVFINGCHTTAFIPELALNFVSSFLRSKAAGVIGTEITIFESLGSTFAEDCLRNFLDDEKTIGEAVRLARLELLKKGNPLGLVYNVYANTSLRLKKTQNPNGSHD